MPPTQLNPTTLAIDVGGSGLKAAVLDVDGAMITDRVRIDTPTGAPPEAVVALLAELVRDLPDYGRVGVGFPGMVRDGVVRTAPNLGHAGWRGFPPAAPLQEALGQPVRIANDANCLALSEASDGAAAGAEVVFGVILGTGVGGGIVVRGHVLDGPNGIAGEWGHNPRHCQPAPICRCRLATAAASAV